MLAGTQLVGGVYGVSIGALFAENPCSERSTKRVQVALYIPNRTFCGTAKHALRHPNADADPPNSLAPGASRNGITSDDSRSGLTCRLSTSESARQFAMSVGLPRNPCQRMVRDTGFEFGPKTLVEQASQTSLPYSISARRKLRSEK